MNPYLYVHACDHTYGSLPYNERYVLTNKHKQRVTTN